MMTSFNAPENQYELVEKLARDTERHRADSQGSEQRAVRGRGDA